MYKCYTVAHSLYSLAFSGCSIHSTQVATVTTAEGLKQPIYVVVIHVSYMYNYHIPEAERFFKD